MAFSELVTRFERERLPMLAPNTRKAYRGSLDRFCEYFVTEGKDPKVHEVRQGHVRGFLNWRRVAALQGGPKGSKPAERTASARTLQKDRAVLHAVFGFAEEFGDPHRQPRRKGESAEGGSAGAGDPVR